MKGFLPAVVACAIAALPDTVTGGVFLTLWISPFAFGQHGVRNGMLVMLVEFLLVHATVMLPVMIAIMLAGRDTVLTRVLAVVALTLVVYRVVAGYEFVLFDTDQYVTANQPVLRDPDGRLTPVNAGQAVGSVTTARPAALVIEDLCTGAAALLARWARSDLDGVPVQ